ncbi:MAG: hypothetical protein JW849_09455 [Phycisphaerae bacterium]|nr:hypothetical protein [Phycisphaerae bacterium]
MKQEGTTTTRSADDAFSALRELGSVEEMRRFASAGKTPSVRVKVNSHIHLPPNFSAFRSVAEAVELAAEQGVRVLCASNYYDFTVFGEFFAKARSKKIFPLFGTEIIARIDELLTDGVRVNDPGNPGRMYICGKGITAFSPLSRRAGELLGWIRAADEARMAEMIARLGDVFAARGLDVGLTEQAVKERIVRRHGCDIDAVVLQERHVAQAFQEALFEKVPRKDRAAILTKILGVEYTGGPDEAVKIQGEIRAHLLKAGKPAFVAEQFVNYPEARELILQLGGIPCYPTLADGAKVICEYETPVEALIENLQGMDVHMAEMIPIRNRPDVLAEYVTKMRAAGVAVAGGTEHNTLDKIGMEPTCLGGQPVPEEVKDVFREGACVIAAHQFLRLHGECGYVDAEGNPNPDYDSAEDRIQGMAKLGAAVIENYFEKLK